MRRTIFELHLKTVVGWTLASVIFIGLMSLVIYVTSEGVTAEESSKQARQNGLTLVAGAQPMRYGNDIGVEVNMGSTACKAIFYGSEDTETPSDAHIDVWQNEGVQTRPIARFHTVSLTEVTANPLMQAVCTR